jgi:hypothetical protein
MKMSRCRLKCGRLFFLPLMLLACGAKVSAQTAASNTIPVVAIQATVPVAFIYPPEPGGPTPFSPSGGLGVFTVFRHGNTNLTLNVYYQIAGTASNGVDFAQIPNWVTIPAGATSNSISILPLANSPASDVTKTVVLQLAPAPTLNPVNFEIGVPSNAVVYIETTNPPLLPDFGIESPNDGTVFYTPTNIFIDAGFNYLGGYPSPTNVEFFANASDLGKGIFGPFSSSGGFANFTWTNPPPGGYALTAVASYNGFASVTSAPVNISVQTGPPQTNLPPLVSIFVPTNGAVFFVSFVSTNVETGITNVETYIELLAKASDPNGTVTNVEFFAGTNDLGAGTPVVLDPPGVNGVTGFVYSIYWRVPSLGNYALTAVDTDDGGVSATSAAVNVTIQPIPPPPIIFSPEIRIISPPNGAVFRAPINLPLFAYAYPPGFQETSVRFNDGTNFLGLAHPVSTPTPLPPTPGGHTPSPVPVPPTALPANIYELVWSNAPVGNHVLTAGALFSNSNNFVLLIAVSAPVNITILPPLPPPTNRPAIVSIVATDPVAIEGTNSWVWAGETNSTPTWAAWPPPIRRFFTNSAPKTATFTVRRFGNTNDDLTLPYDIGGTASNGVDYVALPGSVTIPAGEHAALITVVPIDNGPTNVNKTVVLTLTSSTNTPPDYVLGFPRRAAAIIIDSNGPRPATAVLPDKCFHLVIPGPDAAWFCIEYSTDMANWTPVCTNQVINGSIDFVDPDAPSNSSRFYRAVPVTNTPSD